MPDFEEQRRIATPTGQLSQQTWPSARRDSSFLGGYLVPSGRFGMPSASSTAGGDSTNSLTRSTGAADPHAVSERIVAPVVPLPRPPERAHLRAIQRWEGVVDAVSEEAFVARLYDRHRAGRPEEAEFPLSDVADGDRGLVVEDAVFYWTIGYLVSRGGQRTRTSTIRFRRLPVWTEQELRDAAKRAVQTARALEWR